MGYMWGKTLKHGDYVRSKMVENTVKKGKKLKKYKILALTIDEC